MSMSDSPFYDVLIIGAGASGLICALQCARAGRKVLVLEKAPLIGRKILVSGNGRCNFTNRFVSANHYQGNPTLLRQTLNQFSFSDCLAYFDRLGVLYTQEAFGRFFPQTGKATAITDAFKAALQETNATILTNTEVVSIQKGSVFTVRAQNGTQFQAKNIVLACGSCAYPQVTGTTKGYELAKQLGHTIHKPLPALSGVCLKENLSRLNGLRFQVQVTAPTLQGAQSNGEIIFTSYGINGPAVLNISSVLARALVNGPVPLQINFLPHVKNPQDYLNARLEQFGHRKPKEFFAGLLHESLANVLIDFQGLRKNKPMSEQFDPQKIFQTLLCWPVTVTATRPWNEAMVATGGVNTREINYNTFESLICPHVFLTGELLDVDGISGGFNLHFAWASGICAARALTKESELWQIW